MVTPLFDMLNELLKVPPEKLEPLPLLVAVFVFALLLTLVCAKPVLEIASDKTAPRMMCCIFMILTSVKTIVKWTSTIKVSYGALVNV